MMKVAVTNKTTSLQQADDPEYAGLVSQISDLWESAKKKAAIAVNKELLDANWQTGQYIVEFPDFVIASPKNLHQRVSLFSDVLPSALFVCKPPCSEVA